MCFICYWQKITDSKRKKENEKREKRNREKERVIKMPIVGPHRDDIIIKTDETNQGIIEI